MTRLVIRGEKLNLEAFAPLSGLTDLVHLDMAGAHHYTAADLGPLSTLVKLEHIDLSGPGPTSREPLRHIGHLHFVTHCTALRHLDLSGWKGVGPEGLRHLAGVPSLRSLRLRNWDVSSACLLGLSSETTSAKGAKPSGAPLSMLSRLPNLEALDVADPGPATDADLEPVSALTGLTRLRLEGWKDVDFTGAALERLLGLQGLRDLSLARCEFVHDDALAGLARWRRLACLNVSGTGAGKGLLGAIEALMDLEELDVTGTGITRTAVMRALTADAKTTVSRGGLRALWCDEDGEVAVNHRWARAMGRAEYVRAPPSFTLVIRAGLSWASALSHATTLDLSAVQAHLTRDAMDFIGLLAQLKCLVLRNVSFGDIGELSAGEMPLPPRARLTMSVPHGSAMEEDASFPLLLPLRFLQTPCSRCIASRASRASTSPTPTCPTSRSTTCPP